MPTTTSPRTTTSVAARPWSFISTEQNRRSLRPCRPPGRGKSVAPMGPTLAHPRCAPPNTAKPADAPQQAAPRLAGCAESRFQRWGMLCLGRTLPLRCRRAQSRARQHVLERPVECVPLRHEQQASAGSELPRPIAAIDVIGGSTTEAGLIGSDGLSGCPRRDRDGFRHHREASRRCASYRLR